MKYAFISGIPASGKSFLAEKISRDWGVLHIDMDDLREDMSKDPKLKRWVDFFSSQDEAKYWERTSCVEQWENLKKQAEAFWPTYQKRIDEISSLQKISIFEGVSILPHLASRYLKFPGIYLVNDSVNEIFLRNKANPRWGKTADLQMRESEAFVGCETVMYEKEAMKYGYKVYRNSLDAEKELLSILGYN